MRRPHPAVHSALVGGQGQGRDTVKLKRSLAAVLMLAVLGTLLTACGPNNSPSKFGINLFGDDSRGLDLMQQAGFKWVRVFMFWEQLETSRGGYDATQVASYDAVLNDLSHRGFSVMVVLQLTPHWAMTSPPKTGTCSWDSNAGPPAIRSASTRRTAYAGGESRAMNDERSASNSRSVPCFACTTRKYKWRCVAMTRSRTGYPESSLA